jgi:two-component system sensor histidine kinase KdpD
VLCNLLENAAKYTPEGTAIDIHAEVDDGELLLTVEDNGPGFPPGMEEKIFEKFLRGESETDTPGVGLGLAICRAVMKAHKGRIWAQNRSEGGAAFHLAFPLGQPPSVPELPEEGENA